MVVGGLFASLSLFLFPQWHTTCDVLPSGFIRDHLPASSLVSDEAGRRNVRRCKPILTNLNAIGIFFFPLFISSLILYFLGARLCPLRSSSRQNWKFLEWFFGFLLGHVNLLALPQHQHTNRTSSAFAKQITRWVRLPSKLPYYFVIFSKLYFVFDFVPFFRFLTLSFSSHILCSKVPWKRTGQSCPKRRDKENSCAGAEGELKDKLEVVSRNKATLAKPWLSLVLKNRRISFWGWIHIEDISGSPFSHLGQQCPGM